MATLNVTNITRAGVDVAGVAPTAVTGDEWANTGRELLLVKNGSGAPINVTLDLKGTIDAGAPGGGLAITDKVVPVAAGETAAIGPFPPGIYNDKTTGRAKAICSAVVTVTIKALKLPSL